MKRIVVVGYGIAGVTACHTLRDEGFDAELTVIGDEPSGPYSRPALSKAALVEGNDLDAHLLPRPTHGGTELRGCRVSAVDPVTRTITLAGGETIGWDGLVIATGGLPRRLTDSPDEFVLRTLDDARRLQARFASRPSVIVVGGGPLGMELASGAAARGCEVTLVSPGMPMLRHLGAVLAARLGAAARARGVRIVDGQAVAANVDSNRAEVTLADGRVLAGEALVSAIGDRPCDAYLTGSGLLRDGRLETDSRGRVVAADGTVRDDIVAAGDVAFWPVPDGLIRQPLWTTAIEQAKTAAAALLRGDAAPELEFTPYFWTEQFGITLRLMGQFPPVGEATSIEDDPEQAKALLRWHGDRWGTAAAINYRIPLPKLRRLATELVAG